MSIETTSTAPGQNPHFTDRIGNQTRKYQQGFGQAIGEGENLAGQINQLASNSKTAEGGNGAYTRNGDQTAVPRPGVLIEGATRPQQSEGSVA